MRKSKVETAETRERIVARAAKLFQSRGLEATSLADVMKSLKMTTGGFYRHFESKEALVVEANQKSFDQLLQFLKSKIEGKTPAKAVDLIVSTYLAQLESSEVTTRCPLVNNGSELGRAEKAAKAEAERGFENLSTLLSDQLAQWPNDLNDSPRSTADAIVTTLVGTLSMARLIADEKRRKKIVSRAQLTIKMLLATKMAGTSKQKLTDKQSSDG